MSSPFGELFYSKIFGPLGKWLSHLTVYQEMRVRFSQGPQSLDWSYSWSITNDCKSFAVWLRRFASYSVQINQ